MIFFQGQSDTINFYRFIRKVRGWTQKGKKNNIVVAIPNIKNGPLIILIEKIKKELNIYLYNVISIITLRYGEYI